MARAHQASARSIVRRSGYHGKGDILGFVALQRGEGPAINVVRMANALDAVLSRIDPRTKPTWAGVSPEPSPSPPAEGPLETPKPTPPGVAQTGKLQLIYSPTPQYPIAARSRITRSKEPVNIEFTSPGMGRCATSRSFDPRRTSSWMAQPSKTLRKWKATPGQEWTASVPITFQP